MRKLYSIFAIALMAMCAFSFSSCDNKGDETEELVASNSVYQTKWITFDAVYTAMYGTRDGEPFVVLDFSTKTQVDWYVQQGNKIVHSCGTMSYTQSGNIVKITTDSGKTAVYEINGRKMTKTNDEGLRYTSFTKQ